MSILSTYDGLSPSDIEDGLDERRERATEYRVCRRRHLDEHVKRRVFERVQREMSGEFVEKPHLASAVAVTGKKLVKCATIF